VDPQRSSPIEARVNKGALGVKNTPEFRTKRSIVNAKINKKKVPGEKPGSLFSGLLY
jgi:hypothetical protein